MRALCLVGGGAKGIVQAGMLKRVHELGAKIDVIFGTSSGSLNAALYSQGDIDLMEHLWMTMRNGDVKSFNPFNVISKGSIYDNKPLYKTLQKYLDPTKMQIETWATVTCVETNSFKRMRLDKHQMAAEMLLASTAIPGLFPRVTFDDGQSSFSFFDGGIVDDYNVDAALEKGATEIIILHPSRPGAFNGSTLVSTLEWAYGLLSWSNYVQQMSRLGLIVPTISRMTQHLSSKAEVTAVVCVPPTLIKCPLFDFDYNGLDRKGLMLQGYNLAKQFIG